jgi:hypothetical protein
MTDNPTYNEIANDFYLWLDHVERHLTGDEAREFFDSLTFEERIKIMVQCFGEETIDEDTFEWLCEQIRHECGDDECAEEVLHMESCSLEESLSEWLANREQGLSLEEIIDNYLADNSEFQKGRKNA